MIIKLHQFLSLKKIFEGHLQCCDKILQNLKNS